MSSEEEQNEEEERESKSTESGEPKRKRRTSSKYSPAGAERLRRLKKKKEEEAFRNDPEGMAMKNRVSSFKYRLTSKEGITSEKVAEALENYVKRDDRIHIRSEELENMQYAALPPPGWTMRTSDRFHLMPYDIEHEINILERKSRGNPPYWISKFVIDKRIEFLKKCIDNVYLMPYPAHLATIVPEERQYRAVPLHIEDVIEEHQAKAKRLREVADPRYHVEEAQVEYLNYCNNQLLPLGNLQYIKYSESLRKHEVRGQFFHWIRWEMRHGHIPTPEESDEEYSTSFANSRKPGEASAAKFWTLRY